MPIVHAEQIVRDYIDGLQSRIKTLEAALRLIASCDKRADGDVVDIARRALSQQETINA